MAARTQSICTQETQITWWPNYCAQTQYLCRFLSNLIHWPTPSRRSEGSNQIASIFLSKTSAHTNCIAKKVIPVHFIWSNSNCNKFCFVWTGNILGWISQFVIYRLSSQLRLDKSVWYDSSSYSELVQHGKMWIKGTSARNVVKLYTAVLEPFIWLMLFGLVENSIWMNLKTNLQSFGRIIGGV